MSNTLLKQREAGILLHPTSLPGGIGNGDLGPDAYYFVQFLVDCGLSVWQTLPLCPTHGDRSPYNGASAYAGNPLLIAASGLQQQGWVTDNEVQTAANHSDPDQGRLGLLTAAWRGFQRIGSPADKEALALFGQQQAHWLEDYGLYQAIREQQGELPWFSWPLPLRNREPRALGQARRALGERIAQVKFEQFVFFHQWKALRSHANSRGIRIFGDMPLFVAHDSADVWSCPHYFQLDTAGQPTAVAGVPPDYFAEKGQRWGNPLYNWQRLEAEGFRWWIQRLQGQLALFDYVRIDHFRGLESHWAIPAEEDDPRTGRWVVTPGDALFAALREGIGELPLIAEDLGDITPAVEALRCRQQLPGMKVMQFGFSGDPSNPHLLHQHQQQAVVYTGTHDNDTTVGWFATLPSEVAESVRDYLGYPQEPMPWPLIRSALSSVARLAILPLQDVLELGGEHRMNLPGVQGGNWRWRFTWNQVREDLALRLTRLVRLYGRWRV